MNATANRSDVTTDKLVSTEWVAENMGDSNIRLVESNEDPLVYHQGHIPGAIEIDWIRDLNDAIRRDYLSNEAFSELLSKAGIGPDTTVVFYGDKNNWWATYTLWVFELFGFTNSKIMDGGSLKWKNEGRELTKEIPNVAVAPKQNWTRDDSTIRAFRDEVLSHQKQSGQLIDVRSPMEFSGERTHMEGYPNEGALRGGHIPGAKSIPWAKAVNPETGEFLSLDELNALYGSFSKDNETIVYCRIGERSSHTWFVMKYLLGHPNVRNYDGSWTEWGNLVGVPIEK
ncbi:MAG: sulfurtransferase [Chthonomonas sp.]|nr:sulfurtransferase [Chthonomonas sp.]